ncbi:hypothetical protein PYJP_16740 [Pyrofollis japonicus]|uniref:hypothetical protein n=1 Tax=Pyrofollis japonicus TaxID=3060460 RepID=UPI00295AF6B2|nr:hypothetical protein [Pyrofollis japonicus]BEP18322.1 hypothetical protein PYJP_16740 [Pyrofollis japonicus]
MRRLSHKQRQHPCCRKGYRGELCELLEALLRNAATLFDKNDCLNSDGRRLFEIMVRLLLDEHPEHRRVVGRARKKPCIEEIVSLASLTFYECDALELYHKARGIISPYSYVRPQRQ